MGRVSRPRETKDVSFGLTDMTSPFLKRFLNRTNWVQDWAVASFSKRHTLGSYNFEYMMISGGTAGNANANLVIAETASSSQRYLVCASSALSYSLHWRSGLHFSHDSRHLRTTNVHAKDARPFACRQQVDDTDDLDERGHQRSIHPVTIALAPIV
jgi:hypothetical protein